MCNAAGPCGYGIQRQLALMEHDRVVVAPSLIPRRPGERIKTVRRDAINLAKLHRAGGLTSAWVPDQASRRPRSGAGASGRGADAAAGPSATVRLPVAAWPSLQPAAWTLMHRRWLAGLRFEHAVHHIVLEDYIAAVEAARAQRDRLEAHAGPVARHGGARACAAWRMSRRLTSSIACQRPDGSMMTLPAIFQGGHIPAAVTFRGRLADVVVRLIDDGNQRRPASRNGPTTVLEQE